MDEKELPYRMPDGFNPYVAADAVRGLTDAINHLSIEGYGQEARMRRGHKAGMDALVELLQQQVLSLHDYLMDIENRTTLHLPMCEADFDAIDVRNNRKGEVRETAAMYSIR